MYTFDSRIRYSESDGEAKLSLEGLIDYFQDASTFHSEDLGLGIHYLKEEQKLWVLSAWQIVVDRYPAMGERVVIGTFPYDFKGCFGSRNFFLKSESGEFLAKANSIWTLLDLQNQRPTKPTPIMLEKYALEEKLDMEYAPRKIEVPKGGSTREAILVHRHHLDTNNHVNNGQYVRMAMEYLPEDFKIGQMRAEYKKQALLGDVLYPQVVLQEGLCVVSLEDAQGAVYVNVEFKKADE
ncbi:MAG: acyl-[Lachnospiraceae bacterium]|nr:acyl-[acyl-carrier-protein] thioesterase [Lachnospiraceae bacterium]